jgi:hypothetical protein
MRLFFQRLRFIFFGLPCEAVPHQWQGYFKGKQVRPRLNGNKRIMYDGKRLDVLNIRSSLFSQQEVQEMIEFLQITKHCFTK